MCKILIILEDFFRGGGGRFLKFFEGKRGNYMKKLHPPLPPPSPLQYRMQPYQIKMGGFSCDKVKFGTAIKMFGL